MGIKNSTCPGAWLGSMLWYQDANKDKARESEIVKVCTTKTITGEKIKMLHILSLLCKEKLPFQSMAACIPLEDALKHNIPTQ